jgi:hypothetical protein
VVLRDEQWCWKVVHISFVFPLNMYPKSYGLLSVERFHGRNLYCNFVFLTCLRDATIYIIVRFVSSVKLFNDLYYLLTYGAS